MPDSVRSGRPLVLSRSLCVNCGVGTSGASFEGVIVCNTCRASVDMFLAQASRQMEFVMTLLRESVRVALLERKFGGSAVPPGGDTRPPTAEEVKAALERLFCPSVDRSARRG